jgi:hypothetical protein
MENCSFTKIAIFATRQSVLHGGWTTLRKWFYMVYVDLVTNIELLFTIPAQPSLPCKKKTALKPCETTTHFDNRGGPQKKLTGESRQSHATKASLELATLEI